MIPRRLIVPLLMGAAGAGANTPADYAYVFPLDTTTSTSSAWRVDLTPDVYAWTQDAALRDIEVFNASGQPVPFAPIALQPGATARAQRAPLPLLGLPASALPAPPGDLRLVIERDADGRLRRIDAGEQTPAIAQAGVRDWLLDASGIEHALDSLVLAWNAPASGIVARFSVDAGDDLQNWRGVASGTVLALEQDGAHLERHDIALGRVRAKYLRLHRLDDGADLVGLAAQARWSDARDAPTHAWLDAGLIPADGTVDAPPPGTTRYDYALPALLPVDGARIELARDNSLAPLTLSARMPGSPHPAWNELAHVTAFRLRSGAQTIRNADVELPTTRLRDFRVESHTPLSSAPHLSVGYRADGFVFFTEGDGPYVLAVGSAHAHRSDYPVDAALASLRAKFGKDWQPPQAALGVAHESGGAAVLKATPTPIPWRRWLLWGVLAAGAAVVGGFALSLLRDARRGAR